jgi:hypothetical protein
MSRHRHQLQTKRRQVDGKNASGHCWRSRRTCAFRVIVPLGDCGICACNVREMKLSYGSLQAPIWNIVNKSLTLLLLPKDIPSMKAPLVSRDTSIPSERQFRP